MYLNIYLTCFYCQKELTFWTYFVHYHKQLNTCYTIDFIFLLRYPIIINNFLQNLFFYNIFTFNYFTNVLMPIIILLFVIIFYKIILFTFFPSYVTYSLYLKCLIVFTLLLLRKRID